MLLCSVLMSTNFKLRIYLTRYPRYERQNICIDSIPPTTIFLTTAYILFLLPAGTMKGLNKERVG